MDTKAVSMLSTFIPTEMIGGINSLPEELLVYIFSLLEINYRDSQTTIKSMLLVCKKWTRIFYDLKVAFFHLNRNSPIGRISCLFVNYKPQLCSSVGIIRPKAFSEIVDEDKAFGPFFDYYKTFELKDFSVTAAYGVGMLYVTDKTTRETTTFNEDDLGYSCIRHIEKNDDNSISVFFHNYFYSVYSLQREGGKISFQTDSGRDIYILDILNKQTEGQPIEWHGYNLAGFDCSFDQCLLKTYRPQITEVWWLDLSSSSVLARFTFDRAQSDAIISSLYKDFAVIAIKSTWETNIYQFDQRSQSIKRKSIDLDLNGEACQVFEAVKMLSQDFLLAALSDEDEKSITICVFALNTEKAIEIIKFFGYHINNTTIQSTFSSFSLFNNSLVYTEIHGSNPKDKIINILNLITQKRIQFSSRDLYPSLEDAQIDSYEITQRDGIPKITVRIKYWDSITNKLILELVDLTITESNISKIISSDK